MRYGKKRLCAKTSLNMGWEERQSVIDIQIHLECLFISCVCCCNISCETMFFRFLTQHLRRKDNVPVLGECAVRCSVLCPGLYANTTYGPVMTSHWVITRLTTQECSMGGGEAREETCLPRVAITGDFPNKQMWHKTVSKNVPQCFILHPAWQNLQTWSRLLHFISNNTQICMLQIINWHMHNV